MSGAGAGAGAGLGGEDEDGAGLGRTLLLRLSDLLFCPDFTVATTRSSARDEVSTVQHTALWATRGIFSGIRRDGHRE